MNLLSLFLLHTAARIMHRIEGRSLTEVLFFRGINIFLAHLEVTYFVLTQGVSAFFPAKGKKGDLQLATNLINSDESSNYSRNFNMHGVSCWIAAFQSGFITSVIKSTHLLSVTPCDGSLKAASSILKTRPWNILAKITCDLVLPIPALAGLSWIIALCTLEFFFLINFAILTSGLPHNAERASLKSWLIYSV